MSGISRVKEKMKKKFDLGEIPFNKDLMEKRGRKMYSLSQEDNLMLKKIFSNRLNLKNQTSVSDIMSEAIQLLYFEEFN